VAETRDEDVIPGCRPAQTASEGEGAVPYVNLQITRGATREQKETVVREFTDTLVRVLGKRPEHTHVVIQKDVFRLELLPAVPTPGGPA